MRNAQYGSFEGHILCEMHCKRALRISNEQSSFAAHFTHAYTSWQFHTLSRTLSRTPLSYSLSYSLSYPLTHSRSLTHTSKHSNCACLSVPLTRSLFLSLSHTQTPRILNLFVRLSQTLSLFVPLFHPHTLRNVLRNVLNLCLCLSLARTLLFSLSFTHTNLQ